MYFCVCSRLNTPQPLAPAACLCVLLVLTVAATGSYIPSTSLLCNFCPLQSCSNDSTTECLPQERCGTSSGRFGSTHILSAQGCLTPDLCNSTHAVTYRGVSYNVTYRFSSHNFTFIKCSFTGTVARRH
uniref:UPAR/Ly6 domain-containing protein n=1 Tax=Oncorhynchus mykiss TaxID=8022 RepID=A0A8C7LMP0_ONCMY